MLSSHVTFLFWVLVLGSACASEALSIPDFSPYANMEGFHWFLDSHTNTAWLASENGLIRISVFWWDGQRARQYKVNQLGEESDARYINNSKTWGHSRGNGKALSQQELSSLRRAIAKLPPESVSPPIRRLVIVTFRSGPDWITRTYDKGSMPSAMGVILHIVGEQPELTLEQSQ